MKKAHYFQHILHFQNPSGTSRGVLRSKETFILEVSEDGRKGIGECGIFRGLSCDDVPEYEAKLKWLCENINEHPDVLKQELRQFPSVWFGYEQAIRNMKYGENVYFPSAFTTGKVPIKINGLIWMGKPDFMLKQIEEKLAKGFSCIKLKIGVDWQAERSILTDLRTKFPADKLELRVDANGGFSFEEAKVVLQELAQLKIHSIEQPIKKAASNVPYKNSPMAMLCAETPIPIALDEELIGINDFELKQNLLRQIQPQYIILKPSLVGGFAGTDEWISIAENLGIGWWITSALESNIGLNAIAQYTFTKNPHIPQGLGTGGLFTNNYDSALDLRGDLLFFRP